MSAAPLPELEDAPPRRPETIGVAVVGGGFMARVHTESLRRLRLNLRGVVGSSPARGAEAAETLGLPRAYGRFEDMLADENVEAVHLVVPNRFHFEMARDALAAGKHVMCEKPLAMTVEQSSELVRLAAERPAQHAAVTYNIRYYPLCLEARQRVAQGELGRLFHVAGSYAQDWLLRPDDYNWRVLAEENGPLRAVADIGTHWLDLVQFITHRKIVSVCADLATVHPRRRRPKGEVQTFARENAVETEPVAVTTDDYGALLLRFDDGTRGAAWMSQVTAGRKNRLQFELAGEHAALSWNSQQPNALWIGRREAPNQTLMKDPALMSSQAAAHAEQPGGHNEGYADTFKRCFADFYGVIAANAPADQATHPTFADGHREIALCEAVRRSAETRTWADVEIDTP